MYAILFIAALLLTISAALYLAPGIKLLNFVDYGPPGTVALINRHAARRLLLPAAVSLVCAYLAYLRPGLDVPLIFPILLAIVGTNVWIAAGISRVKQGLT